MFIRRVQNLLMRKIKPPCALFSSTRLATWRTTGRGGFDFTEEDTQSEEKLQKLYYRWADYYEKEKSPDKFKIFKKHVSNVVEFRKMGSDYGLNGICDVPGKVGLRGWNSFDFSGFNIHIREYRHSCEHVKKYGTPDEKRRLLEEMYREYLDFSKELEAEASAAAASH